MTQFTAESKCHARGHRSQKRAIKAWIACVPVEADARAQLRRTLAADATGGCSGWILHGRHYMRTRRPKRKIQCNPRGTWLARETAVIRSSHKNNHQEVGA